MAEMLFETTKTNDAEQYCVYCHRNKTNGKRYIGQTKHQDNLTRRWGTDGREYRRNQYFLRAINKYGWDNFDHFVIQGNLTKEEADELEILNIAFYNTTDPRFGYNISSGGSNGGHPASEYQKQVASQTFKGKPSWNKGKHLSDEYKQKISESLKGVNTWSKGKTLSKEHIARIKEANTGKIVSQETRQKLAKSSSGRKLSEEAKAKISKANSGRVVSDELRARLRKANKGRKFINNGVKQIVVRPEQLPEYLANGWVMGRIPADVTAELR